MCITIYKKFQIYWLTDPLTLFYNIFIKMYYFGLLCGLVFYSSKFYEIFFKVAQIFWLKASGKPECQNQHDQNIIKKI